MSKKKTLSPTASLASCLDFAARVLSSTETVQEICTKQILAPMVVEAYRCGQQVMKHVDSGVPVDVRKLMKVLQSDQCSNLCRGSPLAELEVADLTWDSKGTVADTMEMELVELEKRAANAQDACVIFSTTGISQAVIWFSSKRYESSHKGSDPKNRQILLYVCPGRVKVVKSVDALITKLYEELPTLRVNGATYNVWTVIMGIKSSHQKEEQRVVRVARQFAVKTQNGGSNQCADEGDLKSFSTRASATSEPSSCEHTNQLNEIARSTESRRSNVAPCDQEIGVGPQLRSTTDLVETAPESQDDKLDLVSPRFSVYREASDTNPFSVKSIFSFGLQQRTSLELQRRSFECLTVADESERATVVLNPDTVNTEVENTSVLRSEVEVELHDDNQIQDTRPMRAVVSASLAYLTALDKGILPDDTALGLGVSLQKGFVWQSCDGKVLRRSVRPQQHLPARVEPTESEVQREVEADRDEEKLDAHVGEKEEVGDCTSDVLPSDEMQKPQDMREPSPLQTPREVGSVDGKVDPPHIFMFLHESSANQARDDNQSVDSPQQSETVMQVTSSVAVSIKSTSPQSESVKDENVNDEMGEPLQTSELLIGHEGDCEKTEVHSITSSELLEENEEDLPMHRPKSAVNYKDKLGARVWWELAYTARRLEREEMMEKRQQAPRQEGDHRDNQQQPATINLRRLGPTGWPKKDKPMEQQEKFTVPDEQNCVDQREVVTVELQPAHKEVYRLPSPTVPKRSLDPLFEHSASSNEKEILSIKIASPSPTLKDSNVVGVVGVVASPLLSVQKLKDNKYCTTVGAAAIVQEGGTVEEVAAECSPSTISPTASRSQVSKTYGHLGKSVDQTRASESAARKSSTCSVSRHLSTPPSSKVSNEEEEENDDETVAQMMWGSTHTSYERERTTNVHITAKEDKLQRAEVTSKIPFSIRGRVPMRSRHSSNTVDAPATDEPPRTSSTEHSPSSSSSDPEEQNQDKQKPSHLRLSKYQASTDHRTQPVPAPHPVATFIALGEENSAATSGKTRQERLNELRQKKLQKLQQARASSLQQQKEKQSQQQTRQPLSFANSVYSKKASNCQLMQNALEFTLLAGGSMEKERALALQALAESTCDNFIVLLKSAKELKFRALYENHVDRDYATRIYSVLPSTSARAPLKLVNSEMISQFFKYSSAKKQFLPVPTRSFTVKTDACALVDQLVFKGRSKNNISALARLL
ncbi:hypothetical protein V7S43_010550 [Phytophthora oleae]|uniref:CKK domain-containing protein n=1 Tax=Phytophthora oleae TaxID=2107226 RepID=A0ABD3FCR4_9STRA